MPNDRPIKRIYIGLPEGFEQIVLWVDDEFRTNPLSLVEGGYDVVVEYFNKQVLGYDKIKYPPAYIRVILRKSPTPIEVIPIYRVFARGYLNEEEYLSNEFKEVWNSTTSQNTIEEALKDFVSPKSNKKNLRKGLPRGLWYLYE